MGIYLHITPIPTALSHRSVRYAAAASAAAGASALLLGLAAPAHADPLTATPADPQGALAGAEQQVGAATADLQPVANVAVSIRVDSPGNDGAVTQAVDAAGAAAQQAGQGVATAAPVAQDSVANLNVAIRIASPGSNGAVSQTIASASPPQDAPNAVSTPPAGQYQGDPTQYQAAMPPATPAPVAPTAPTAPPTAPPVTPAAPPAAPPVPPTTTNSGTPSPVLPATPTPPQTTTTPALPSVWNWTWIWNTACSDIAGSGITQAPDIGIQNWNWTWIIDSQCSSSTQTTSNSRGNSYSIPPIPIPTPVQLPPPVLSPVVDTAAGPAVASPAISAAGPGDVHSTGPELVAASRAPHAVSAGPLRIVWLPSPPAGAPALTERRALAENMVAPSRHSARQAGDKRQRRARSSRAAPPPLPTFLAGAGAAAGGGGGGGGSGGGAGSLLAALALWLLIQPQGFAVRLRTQRRRDPRSRSDDPRTSPG